jgi:hypothetical protein
MTLEQALEMVSVHPAEEIPDWRGNPNWYAVSTDEDGGVIAFFAREVDAFAFRLAIINRLLNPESRI